MKQAELQLKDYVFPEVIVKANPDYVPSTGAQLNCALEDLHLDVDVLVHEDNPHRFAVQVGVRTESATSKRHAYELSVNVFGEFEVVRTISHSDSLAYVTRSGSSILYGAIREMVVSITSRAPWGGFYLPAVDANLFAEAHKKTMAAARESEEVRSVRSQRKARKKSK